MSNSTNLPIGNSRSTYYFGISTYIPRAEIRDIEIPEIIDPLLYVVSEEGMHTHIRIFSISMSSTSIVDFEYEEKQSVRDW